MYVPDVQLHESATLEEATELMSRYEPNARFIAGGTDVLVDLKVGRYGIDHLISISRIDDLCGVSNSPDGLRIGAMTTITELIRSPLIREACPAILDAATQMAAPQIRNVATVGGNIACAAPCADLPPILMALDASLTLVSPTGRRSLALESFFRGPRETAIGRNELLTAVHVPLSPARFGAAYARFGLREGNAIAVAAVAASLKLNDDGTIEIVRIVLNAVAPTPIFSHAAADALIGQTPDRAIFQGAAALAMESARPISDVRGSAEYRRELIGVLTVRALETARRRAEESAS
ncbi:MAG: xanthine dehydrogenase family protein subunit M [Planctomycetes bacterium]|nr:xanthine dehydrogenase family protein subunit M [Planctomycetota bacterium]